MPDIFLDHSLCVRKPSSTVYSLKILKTILFNYTAPMIICGRVYFIFTILTLNVYTTTEGDWQFHRNGFNEILLANITNCHEWQSDALYIRRVEIERRSKELYMINAEIVLPENIPSGARGTIFH